MQSFNKFLSLLIMSLIFSSSICALGGEKKNLDSFKGKFLGQIESHHKMLPSITKFKVNDGLISGEYIIYEKNNLSIGKLSSCKVIEKNMLECKWRDEYGNGVLVVAFSEDFRRLVGEWNTQGEDKKYRWDGLKYDF